jgi:hypothetical protein
MRAAAERTWKRGPTTRALPQPLRGGEQNALNLVRGCTLKSGTHHRRGDGSRNRVPRSKGPRVGASWVGALLAYRA